MDWIELADKSGLGIHPDQLRKMGAGIRLAYEAGFFSGGGTMDTLALQQMRDLRREINEGTRADARSAALHDSIIKAARQVQAKQPNYHVPPLVTNDRSLVLCVADCHYGAEWEISGLHGEVVNRYNPDVFEQRMLLLLAHVLDIVEREDIWDVTLLLCGDSLDGMLRASQLTKLRWGVVESCMRYAEYMAGWIAQLSERCRVKVHSVDGNHTEVRPLGSKRGEHENENFERIIMWYIAERLRDNEHVQVDADVAALKSVEVEGFKILLSHDTDGKALEAAAKQAMLLYGERIDFMVCGHKHREQEAVSGYTDTGSSLVIRVPSICGTDRYAQKLGFGGRPGAYAMVLEKGYGRRCVYPIGLG